MQTFKYLWEVWFTALMLSLRPHLYIYRKGEYKKVVGPTSLLNSIKGVGGYLIIGDQIHIVSGLYFSGENTVTSNTVNGWVTSEMETTSIDASDKKKLGL